MDPQELIRIIKALDQLVETATKETVNNRDFGGQKLLDFVGEEWSDLMDVFPREDGLLVYGPYNLEELVGAGRSDLNLVIEPLADEANEDLVSGFRLMIMDQNTQSVGGPNMMRPEIDEIFILDLGEFSTKQEMENLFTKTSDIDGATASVSLVGDKLDEIFPNSTASIEMALTNQGPVISDRIRSQINRSFIPPYALEAFEKVDAEQSAQYGELTGDVEVPDTVEAAAADVVPDDISQVNLEDDVAEVNNDFVYNKFNEKQRTADNVIFKELDDGTIELLVIKRKRGPHRSLFALPGGIVETDVNLDQIIQGVVDPGTPSFRDTEVHDFLMPFETESTVLDISDKYRGNEIFGAEALREAIEEVNLRKRFIDKSFYLPIKFDRYDWDARAAKGVDVGGIGIIIKDVTKTNTVDGQKVKSVVETWTPKAQDDAVSYEWIKLDDVISGEKQLAFGHVEFVEDTLRFALKKNLLQKSNQETIYTNESKYDYNDLTQLKERVAETKRRNTEIILESNKVRVANSQPEIPISGNNIVDRQNKALIDSIRGLKSYTPYVGMGKEIKPFTPQMIMSPDFIFHNIIQYTTQEAGTGLIFSDKEIESKELGFEFADDPESTYEKIKIKPEARNKAKVTIREKVLKQYASDLKWKINDGMQIEPFIAAMYDNAEQIVNSEEFDILLDELIDQGFASHKEDEVGTTEVIETYYTDSFDDGEVKEYAGLHEGNTVIQRDGIEKAVDDNINYLINSDYKSGPALAKLRVRNTGFFKNTFPDEIYLPSWEYWKTNNSDVPQALLDSKQATLGADGRLKGFVYHGSPGLNARGRAILDILEKHGSGSKTDMRGLFADLTNKINYETDLNWLDPSKYRSQMLRLNYMYTTSNPFVASSYSMGGHNTSKVNVMNIDANDKFTSILNSEDIKNNPEIIAKIDKDLKKIGFTIKKDEGLEGVLRIRAINESEYKPLFVDPAISQIEFDAPGDSILHTDMPLVRQINNPKVKNLINNIVNNTNIETIFDEEMVDRFLFNIMDQLKKTGTGLLEGMSEADQSKIYNMIKNALEGRNTSKDILDLNNRTDGSEVVQTIKDFYIDNMSDVQDNVSKTIQEGLEEGKMNFSDVHYILRDNLYGNESITNEAREEAWEYIKSTGVNNTKQQYFYDKRLTYADVLFNKLLNDEYAFLNDGKRIDFDLVMRFANELDPSALGGSYRATKDLLYIKYFFENMEIDSPMYNDAIDYVTRNMASDSAMKINGYIEPDSTYLRDIVRNLENYFLQQKLRIQKKFGEDVTDFIKLNLEDEVFAVQNNILPEVKGDKTLVNFLRKLNGIPKRYVSPVGNSYAAGDILLLKSLSQSGIEIVAGTGGGRVGNDFHDVFGIVDPGDKFGTGVPREAKFKVKPVEINAEKIQTINDLTSGVKGFADLDDQSIRAIAELIPLQVLLDNDTLSDETKERYSKLYKDLEIQDIRFFDPKRIEPSAVDGALLQQFDGFRQLIAQQGMFGNVEDEVIQAHVAELFNKMDGQIAPEDRINFIKSSGLLKTFADGLDVFDAAVLAPVLVDVIMSKTSGTGSATETIGGAVADVAEKIYDPEEVDTTFESLYGSPEDPSTLAGAMSESFQVGKEEIVNPLFEAAQSNRILKEVFGNLKEGAISALETVRDGFGMNDWLYNVKRDMYVSSVLKERGYTDGKRIPPDLVKKIENEYESYVPKEVNKYGQPLDVSDTSRYSNSFYTAGGGGSGVRHE